VKPEAGAAERRRRKFLKAFNKDFKKTFQENLMRFQS
jgi:hypothetical protein